MDDQHVGMDIEAERHQREVAEMLRDLVVTVNSTLDVDQVLNIAARRLQILHHATACSVSFLEEDGKTFVFRATTDPGIDVSQHMTFPARGSIAGRAIRECTVQIVNDVDQTFDYRAEIARRTGIATHSLLTAPLFSDGKPLGVIQVLSASPDAFNEADAELLTTTAALIETAIARAQAYAQAVQLAKSERYQREVAETLRRVAILISASLDLDTVLDRILEQLAQVIKYDTTSLILVEGNRLTVRAVRGYAEPDPVLAVFSNIADNPLFQEMLESRRPIVIPDVSVDDRFRHWAGTASVRSWIGVPLVVRDRVIGQLAVDKYQPDFYDEADAELASAFAQQAAIAIQNAQLYEAEQRQRQIAEALRQAGAALSSTLNYEEVLDRILEQVGLVVPHDATNIMLIKGKTARALRWRGYAQFGAEDYIASVTLNIADTPNLRIMRETKLPLAISHVEGYAEWVLKPEAAWIKSHASTPIRVRDRVIGFLNVDSVTPGFFSQADAERLQILAQQAAIAIENARLYEEERERLAEVERHNRELVALHAVAAAISSSLNTDVILREALAHALQAMKMGSGGVYLLDKAGSTATLRIRHNLPEEVTAAAGHLETDSGLPAQIVQTGEPITAEDVAHDARITRPEVRSALVETGYQSMVAVPLRAQGRVLGAVFGLSRRPRRFSHEDLGLLVAIGDEMGVAVENSRLHQALQEHAADLEVRVEARTAELNRERERLLAVLESAGDAITITDNQGTIEYVNPAWVRLTDFSAQEVVGKPLHILQSGQTPPEVYNEMWSTIQAGWVWRGDLVDERQDGSRFEMSLTIAPVFNELGETVNLVGVFHDVTRLKRLERLKDEFVSTAAHELRSPITSLLGFSELLLSRPDLSDQERTRFMHYINDHATHLKQLVDDLLDISRIEAGTGFIVKMESSDLTSVFEREIRSWQEANPDHVCRLQAVDNWPKVNADRDRVVQVIRNLLSNATKYSPDGGAITVGVSPVGGYMEVTVADEGIGMTDDERRHLFEKFWRADASSTAVGGTGLGLVIVKHIVEQHGGHIWVESTRGKGTVVHFSLPLTDHQTTVLVVEDEDAVREIEKRILAGNGLAVLTASGGEEAIEMAQTYRPDLVLLDLMMPGVTGKDVAQALKANPATAYIPVLVVSARSDWQTIEETYMLGAVDFLTKPFEYQELLSRVRRALKTATPQTQGGTLKL